MNTPAKTAVFTVCTTNHVHRARALMASAATHYPEADRYVVLADPLNHRFVPERENFTTIPPDQLNQISDWRRLRFLIPPSGLCCLLKPIGANHLLQNPSIDRVVYLDADTLLLNRPDSIEAALHQHDIVLTPHLVNTQDYPEVDLNTMRSGAFNAGVFAIKQSDRGVAFLDWWSVNMMDPAKMSYDWNYDQGWLNLAPTSFPETHILRDPGCNVAFWNLHERKIESGALPLQPVADRVPVSIFHFSFFEWRTPDRLAGPFSSQLPPPPQAVMVLLHHYAKQLQRHGADEVENWGYPYAHFSDGHKITGYHRAYFHQRVEPVLPDGADPFDADLQLPGLRGLRSLRQADSRLSRMIRWLKLRTF